MNHYHPSKQVKEQVERIAGAYLSCLDEYDKTRYKNSPAVLRKLIRVGRKIRILLALLSF